MRPTCEPTSAPPFEPAQISLTSVNAAAALTLWALLGFEAASIASRNVRDPARTVPRATIIGTLVVGVLYLLVATPVPADEYSVAEDKSVWLRALLDLRVVRAGAAPSWMDRGPSSAAGSVGPESWLRQKLIGSPPADA